MRMKPIQIILTVLMIIGHSVGVAAQKTTVYTEADLAYKKGINLYEKGIFPAAQDEFQKSIELLRPVHHEGSELLLMKAELHFAKAAVRMNLPDSEKLIFDFTRKYDPDPIANQAMFEMANYYFNSKEYEKAATLYSQINSYDLPTEQRSQVKFNEGYSLFVKKHFPEAKTCFKGIKEIENRFYYPSNYYYGMCAFFDDKYDEAVQHFQRVSKSKKYKDHTPYYIAQIYFAKGEFDNLITHTNAKINNSSVRNRTEMHQLLGLAYFEKGDYEKALPLMEYYAENSSKLREEDFYQLGFAQYQTGHYDDAIVSFEKLNQMDSKLGQTAMYTLADCQIKAGNKTSARNAFGLASKMNYDPIIQEDALFNFAKLSYELSYDTEAINALQDIRSDSKYYIEAQSMLSSIFLNTRNYEQAMNIIEGMPTKTPKIRETYQKVAYYRGVQLFKDGRKDQAKILFNKSLENPIDDYSKALALYWLGEMEHNEKNYNASIVKMDKFLRLAKRMNNLPDEANIETANYIQGYNHLKQKDYTTALGHFQDAAVGLKQNAEYITNENVLKKILPDATLRAGDCYFKKNQYDKAVRFYDEAVQNRYPGFVYALYQKAMIKGLQGKTTDKIIALESITEQYNNSDYTDDALLQLGITYQDIGKFEEARAPLERLVRKYSGKSNLVCQGLLRLGLISYNQGDLQTAIQHYKNVFNNNPSPAEAQAALASLQEIYVDDLGQPEAYFAFLDTVPGYKVEDAEKDNISFKAAEVQYENAEYEKAIPAYTKYINKYPNGANVLAAYYHRGESYSVLKDYPNALQDYEKVIARGQNQYYEKAVKKAAIIAYNHDQDFIKSFDFYSKWEKVASNDDARFEAQLGALRSAYRIDKIDAVEEMAIKVADNPKASTDQQATAFFYVGKIAFDRKDYDNALIAFNEVTKLSDNEQTAEARYNIAYIYYLQRDLDMAEQLCINANRESSSYQYWVAKSVILLADVYAEKGALFNARYALESLLENYQGDEILIAQAKEKLALIKKKESTSSLINDVPVDDTILEMDEGEDDEIIEN